MLQIMSLLRMRIYVISEYICLFATTTPFLNILSSIIISEHNMFIPNGDIVSILDSNVVFCIFRNNATT